MYTKISESLDEQSNIQKTESHFNLVYIKAYSISCLIVCQFRKIKIQHINDILTRYLTRQKEKQNYRQHFLLSSLYAQL